VCCIVVYIKKSIPGIKKLKVYLSAVTFYIKNLNRIAIMAMMIQLSL